MSSLVGQTILVIGGSSGIGFGVAKLSLLERAALVTIASSNKSRVEDAVARLVAEVEQTIPDAKERVRGEVVDAKRGEEVKALMERVGEIDHLVWTSGDRRPRGRFMFPEIDLDESVKEMFNVRFWGSLEAAKSAKIKAGGSIVLTTGTTLKKPTKGWTLAAGVMGSLDAITRSLAVDLAPIRVNNVSPGLIITELMDSLMDKQTQEAMIGQLASKLPVKHVAYPDEVAEAYVFLMKCKYITGQRIEVDGGYSLA